MAEPAVCASVISNFALRLFGLTSTAKRAALGNSSCNNANRLAETSICMLATPVALPSGRLRLATRPIWTGSPAVLKTIGIVVVAALAASAIPEAEWCHSAPSGIQLRGYDLRHSRSRSDLYEMPL